MLNPLNFISKFIKSGNQKELDQINKIVIIINNLEEKYRILKDDDFPKKTIELKKELKWRNIGSKFTRCFCIS